MSYHDFLAARGYQRAVIQRTEKAPGDLVLHDICKPAQRIPAQRKVIAMRLKAVQA